MQASPHINGLKSLSKRTGIQTTMWLDNGEIKHGKRKKKRKRKKEKRNSQNGIATKRIKRTLKAGKEDLLKCYLFHSLLSDA